MEFQGGHSRSGRLRIPQGGDVALSEDVIGCVDDVCRRNIV